MKCRFLDEITGGKGIVFATGTPISNSMVELYTMQRYLQYQLLEKNHLINFDSWASTFGETVTSIELAPEGSGYRAKTKFAKFYNLPELMQMFKEVADIQTSDTLNLPVPEANYKTIVAKPSDIQKDMVTELGERAERIRAKQVEPKEDNMLKITNEGRKLALDQRLMNELLPDYEGSKINICCNNVYNIWKENIDKKSTQLIFCDLSTPTNEEKFNVYDDIREKLTNKGIPKEEIVFIHEATTEAKKQELFSKVRNGNVRVLIGSTQKMGAGTNVQKKLIAIHHLDCPWRPADLTQRNGRGIRQGNENKKIDIFNYVTEGTFDAYLYQLIENKQKFISQIMTSKTPVRTAEDVDARALNYAEIKALATGNPLIKEKTELESEVSKLKLLKQSHLSQIYRLEDLLVKYYPVEIKNLENKILNIQEDIEYIEKNTNLKNSEEFSPMILKGKEYSKKEEAGNKLLDIIKNKPNKELEEIGLYRGMKIYIEIDTYANEVVLKCKNKETYKIKLGTDKYGNITRIDNVLNNLENELNRYKNNLENTKVQYKNAEIDSKKEFEKEDELRNKQNRLDTVNALLKIDNKEENVIMEDEVDNKKEQNQDSKKEKHKKDPIR